MDTLLKWNTTTKSIIGSVGGLVAFVVIVAIMKQSAKTTRGNNSLDSSTTNDNNVDRDLFGNVIRYNDDMDGGKRKSKRRNQKKKQTKQCYKKYKLLI
jgi:hypothetical protein